MEQQKICMYSIHQIIIKFYISSGTFKTHIILDIIIKHFLEESNVDITNYRFTII